MILPDQHHIEQIRQHLWNGREFGRAAVMVGSGFSRNADKKFSTSPDFPLWWDLKEQLCNELPLNPTSTDLDVLKLANEYEKTHGRQKLEQFLLDSIPDKKYVPGKLHELFLSLPWSDVFTTNYDTLLERTSIVERNYDVIRIPADIPGRMKPRIVKLHGSFESYRPFIFTQKDYKSYPKKFAPFVNMVQQSIMENAFCLIGFSGDDPNFLEWIKWVCKNLNEYTPQIYLCGLLNINDDTRKKFEKLKVTTIDLSPLFPRSEWPDRGLRHSKALEWFFLNLMHGKSPDITDWLSTENQTENQRKWKPSKGLPNIPAPSELLSSAEGEVYSIGHSIQSSWAYSKKSSTRLEQSLTRLIVLWQEQRKDYIKFKGWVVLPKKYRDLLWRSTERLILYIFESLIKLSLPNRLLLLFELNWRLEKTLTPLLFQDWVEKIREVVEQINPYPNLIDFKEAKITPEEEEYQQEDWQWDNIQEAWIGLAFALLRAAREEQDRKTFDLWIFRLKNIVVHNPESHSRWYYEQCLFHLCRCEHDVALSIVEKWEEEVSISDFWQIKRASVLAQAFQLEKSQRIAKETLKKIRHCIRPDVVDYYLLSQEGWAMLLLTEIEAQIKRKKGKFVDFNETLSDRWEHLERYNCNPKTELKKLEQEVAKPRPKAQPYKENKKGFLPGRTSRTVRFGGNAFYPELRPGFESLRIFEEGGIPFSFINVQYHSAHIINAAKWTIPFFPTLSFLALIQVCKSDAVKEWLDFIDISILPQEEIDSLYTILYDFLFKIFSLSNKLGINSSFYDEYLSSKLANFTKVLSYLAFRLEKDKLSDLLDLSIKMCQVDRFRKGYFEQSSFSDLLRMLIYTLSYSEIIKRLETFLEFPIGGEKGFELDTDNNFFEPFDYLETSLRDKKIVGNISLNSSRLSSSITRLIRLVREGNFEARKRASLRLSVLQNIDLLTSQDEKLFVKALWNDFIPNSSSNCLPKNTSFYQHAFLILPEPQEGIAKDILSQNIKDEFDLLEGYGVGSNISLDDVRRLCRNLTRSSSPLDQDIQNSDKYINWSSEDIVYFLGKINNWFERYKDGIDKLYPQKNDLLFDYLAKAIEEIIDCLLLVIFPGLKDSSQESKQLALNLINNLKNSGISVVSILPMTLFFDSSRLIKNISKKIELCLLSSNPEKVDDAIIGLQHWLICSQQKQIISPPPELLNILVNKLYYLKNPGLNLAMLKVGRLFDNYSALFNETQLQALLVSLEFILKEVKLPDNWHSWKLIDDDIDSTIEIDDRPEYMRAGAYLSSKLYLNFVDKKDQEIPKILIDWKQASFASFFPEVRRIWERTINQEKGINE